MFPPLWIKSYNAEAAFLGYPACKYGPLQLFPYIYKKAGHCGFCGYLRDQILNAKVRFSIYPTCIDGPLQLFSISSKKC